MENVTIQDLMALLPDFFMTDRAAGITAQIQFNLTGAEGGQWVVSIADATCHVTSGISGSADLIFEASGQDVLDIFYDRLDAMTAYVQGRLRLKGNISLALRLFNLFEVNEEQLKRLKQ